MNLYDLYFDTMDYELCPACGGDGIVQEDEYECDWINFGPRIMGCPDCKDAGIEQEDEHGETPIARWEADKNH